MPTPTYTPLATVTLASATSTVTLSNIPASYRDLILVVEGATATSGRPVMRFNADTGSNYTSVMMAGGSSTYSATTSTTYIDPIPDYSVTGKFSAIWQVMDYSATNKHKTVLVRLNQHAGNVVHATAGRWANTNAVTTLAVLTNNGANYSSGTTFSLYGVIA
jgi:hypothetical protein